MSVRWYAAARLPLVRALVRPLVRALVLALVLALVVAGCSRGGEPPREEAGPELACLPVEQPRDVADINDLIGSYRRQPDFVGADVGASTVLQDGRSLWVFGDTLRSPSFDGPTFVHNSLLVLSDACASVVMPADRGAFVPDRADGVGYWPMSITALALGETDVVGIGLLRVQVVGTGMFDFRILGSSVARVHVPAGGTPVLDEVIDIGPDRVDDTRPTWGAAVALTDDWVYVYGTAVPSADPAQASYGWSLHVARTRIADLVTLGRWEYWNGRAWSRSPRGLATLIPAARGVSRVLSVFERDGSWYAVSKRNDVIGTDLVIWKAPSPHGPFVAGPPVARIPSDDGRLLYMPLAHPDLLPEPGTVVVSWSRNVTDFEAIQEDPTLYRPEFARVPLP